MTNIFLMSQRRGPEDRLTSSWAYVLNTVPRLGQRFVDLVCDRARLPVTEFVTAIDHPSGTQRDRPDFELKCRDWSMLFEHKLDAGLGIAQLERYLDRASDRRRTYLGFVAPRLLDVEGAVLRHPRYKRPRHGKHFLWQDFFPLLDSSRSKLAQDFASYLGVIGVKPWQWGKLGDPFTDEGADEALREVFRKVATRLKQPGRHIVPSRTALGLEIRKPLPGLHLSYLRAAPSIADRDLRLPGRALTLNVWVRRAGTRRTLSPAYGYLRGSEPRIFVADDNRWAKWDPEVYVERHYMTALDRMLGRSPSGAADRMTEFVETCLGHLQGRGYLVEQQREQ